MDLDFVIFIDDFSCATYFYLLRSKDELFDYFQKFINRIENQYEAKIKIFRSDRGTKFIDNKFTQLFQVKEIIH